MDYKAFINFAAIIILSTLSIYHLFIFFGRYSHKKELYNLYFSLINFFMLIAIYGITFLPEGVWNLFVINLSIPFMVLFLVITTSFLIKYSNIGKKINILCIAFSFISFFLVSPVIFLGREWLFKNTFFIAQIFLMLASLVFLINTILTVLLFRYYKDTVIIFILIGYCIYVVHPIITVTSTFIKIPFLQFFQLNYTLEYKFGERTQELAEANEQKTTFFTNFTHETKTPLIW